MVLSFHASSANRNSWHPGPPARGTLPHHCRPLRGRAFGLATSAAARGGPWAGKVPRLVFPILEEATLDGRLGVRADEAATGERHAGAAARWLAAGPARQVLDDVLTRRLHALLEGPSGTEYLYIHLNNDLTDANDNRGKCVPGVAYRKA